MVKWERAFLVNFRVTGNHSAAARHANISRDVVYKRRLSDVKFDEAYRDAEAEACDRLELEAYRRAHDGVRRPLFQAGKQMFYKRVRVDPEGKNVRHESGDLLYDEFPAEIVEYSDFLLIRLLEARRPEKFRSTSTVANDPASMVKIYLGVDESKM